MAKWWFNLKVGTADTTHDAPSHTPGIGQGNNPDGEEEPGIVHTGETGAGRPSAKSTARKSTSINPGARNPVDPSSPNLPPA